MLFAIMLIFTNIFPFLIILSFVINTHILFVSQCFKFAYLAWNESKPLCWNILVNYTRISGEPLPHGAMVRFLSSVFLLAPHSLYSSTNYTTFLSLLFPTPPSLPFAVCYFFFAIHSFFTLMLYKVLTNRDLELETRKHGFFGHLKSRSQWKY